MKTAGIVLAGGQSSRYGRPKMFEVYNDKFFYEYSVEALSANGLSPVIISTNSALAEGFTIPGIELVIEDNIHNGPLFAMNHVMKQYDETDWFFVLTADIPFVKASFIQEMLTYCHADYNAIVPVQEDKLQPLLALYHRHCLPIMDGVLKEEKRSIMALLENIHYKTIPFCKKEPSFININTEKDFKEYTNLPHKDLDESP